MKDKTVLIAKRPISTFNKEVKFSFMALFKVISSGTLAYFTSNTPALIGSTFSLVDIIKTKSKPEILVFSLIIKSLEDAIIEIINETLEKLNPDFTTIEKFQEYREYQELLAELNDKIDEVDLIVSMDFFENPSQLNLLGPIREIIQKWFMIFGLSSLESRNASGKLGSYFVFSLNDNWRTNSEKFQLVFDNLITPFSKITKIELEWRSYHSYLIKQTEESIFDEHFGLKDIFIPLYSYYEKKIEKNEESVTEKHVVDAMDFLNKWLHNTKKSEDSIKVISGGPGSGKSSLAKIYASSVASYGDIKVIYIPLQHLNIRNDLNLSMGDYLQDSNFFTHNPLDEIHNYSSKLLLIFDGLDELSKQGKHAFELARDFIEEIQRKTVLINNTEIKLLVLITGRELTIQNQISAFRRPYQILNLLPYFNPNREEYIDKKKYLRIDLRNKWWQKYSKLKGLNYKTFPKELRNPNLDEITAQPLLNYLVALTYERKNIKFDLKTNLNEIFSDLIKAVFDRQYEKKQHKVITELSLDENNFFRILEEIAISAWHSGDIRTTTIKKIEKHILNNNLSSLFKEFQLGVQAGISRLLTAFYFRQKGIDIDQDKTFEFTHKSFGEYLASRRIINLLMLLSKKIDLHDSNPDEGIDRKEALRKLIETLGVMPFDSYLFTFINNEIKLYPKVKVKRVQQNVISLIEYSLRNGMPVELMSPRPSFIEEQCYYRNSMLSLFVFLRISSSYTKIKSKIKWPNETSLGELLASLRPLKPPKVNRFDRKKFVRVLDEEHHSLINTCFTNMIIENCYISSSDLTYADFSNSELKNVVAAGSDFFGSKFVKTKFNNTNFYRANLKTCIFQDIVFTNIDRSHYLNILQLKEAAVLKNIKGLNQKLMNELIEEIKRREEKNKKKRIRTTNL